MTDADDLWEQLQDREQPTVPVAFPRDPVAFQESTARVEAARRALQDAQARGDADLTEPEQQLEAAETAHAALPVLRFTVRAISARAWDQLVEEHQPSPPQAKQGWAWDPETFRPALLARCVEPAWSPERWAVLWESRKGLGRGELELLFAEAHNLSNRQVRVEVGKD